MRKVIFGNNQGGVGKTTLAWHFCVFLRLNGVKSLAVDTDVNQLDLGKLMFKKDVFVDEVIEGKIYKTDFGDYMWVEGLEKIEGLKMLNYDVVVVDTHPNIYSPIVVGKGDILVIPMEGISSVINAGELLTREIRENASLIIGVLNKATRSVVIGTKELRAARDLGIHLYPFPLKFIPSMRKVWIERRPIWDIDRRSTVGDCIWDISMMILNAIKRSEYGRR